MLYIALLLALCAPQPQGYYPTPPGTVITISVSAHWHVGSEIWTAYEVESFVVANPALTGTYYVCGSQPVTSSHGIAGYKRAILFWTGGEYVQEVGIQANDGRVFVRGEPVEFNGEAVR